MVPPEEIEKDAPTTLPADFGEWDSGDDSSAQHGTASGFDGFPGSGRSPKPPAKSMTARVAVLPAAGRTPSAAPRPPAASYAEVEQVYQPPKAQAVKATVSRHRDESVEEEKKKTGMFVGIGVAALLLIGGSVGYLKMRPKAVAPNQPVASETAAANPLKPTPATPTNGSAPASANLLAASAAATTDKTAADHPAPAQSDAMNQQLNAPSRIPTDLRMLAGKETAPSTDFSAAGAEGLGGGGVSVLSGQAAPKVRVERGKVNISAGVAVGLLIQKANPVYPPIAKQARVSGTVVIQANISKTGAIGNLRAVSGPIMLRQAALDAVKTWRFRPYMLDGEPVEVDTMVNVTFVLPQ